MSSKKSLIISLIIYFGFILFVFIHNLSRGVYGGDVGDMITASAVMGVPHPPGYPLFTFLGFLLTRINLLTPAFMVGLISAVSGATSVILFFLISLKLTKNRAIALIASLILAFNFLFWFYSEIAEVFALNNFFVLLLFYLALLYKDSKKKKYLFALSFMAGLSLTNHQTILLIFPSVLILIYENLIKLIKTPKILISSVLIFVSGLLIYLYVPIASLHNPPVNWDHVKDLNSFLRLVLRLDYGTFSAGTFLQPIFAQRLIILKTYFSYLFVQLTLPVVALSIIGAIVLFIKNKKIFFSIILGFIISGPLFIGYAGFPLFNSFYVGVYERFFVMSSVIFLIFFPQGLLFFINLINKIFRKKTYEPLFLCVFLLIPLLLFYYNFPKTNLSNVYVGDRLAYDLLYPLPKDSILLISGDTALFNVWYIHYALGFRPDIQTVNINGLAGDVYFENLQKKYLSLFPKDKNSKAIKANVIRFIVKEKPVYSYTMIPLSNDDKYTWVPKGLIYKLVYEKENLPNEEGFLKDTDSIWNGFKKTSKDEEKSPALNNLTVSDLPRVYADALLATGNFLISQYKDEKIALNFFEKALKKDSNYYKTYEVFGVYYLTQKKCSEAEKSLNKALSIFPLEKVTYYLLYLTYTDCFNDKNKQQAVITEYKNVLKGDLLKDTKIQK